MRLCPRLCPTQVIEQRVTLGTLERTQLKQLVEAYNRDKWGELIPNVMLGAGGVLAGAGVIGLGYGVYKIAQAMSLEWIPGVLSNLTDDVKAGAKKAKDGVKGTLEEALYYATHAPGPYTRNNPPQPREYTDILTGEICFGPTPDWRDEYGVWHAGTGGTCSQETYSASYSENPLGAPGY